MNFTTIFFTIILVGVSFFDTTTVFVCEGFSLPSFKVSSSSRNMVHNHSNENNNEEELVPRKQNMCNRRPFLSSAVSSSLLLLLPQIATSEEMTALSQESSVSPVLVVPPSGDIKKLFNEARAREAQGNIAAAQRIYSKIVQICPRFIYGWSYLGNTQVVLGSLKSADESYSKAVQLCLESRKTNQEEQFGVPRCNDLYLLLLNRGTVRMNNQQAEAALKDLELANEFRGVPDALILSNKARALELNGLYAQSNEDYNIAISMTSNDVTPFWLRSALIKYQLGDYKGAVDLTNRVETKFAEAPEVVAASATLLYAGAANDNQKSKAQQKFLSLPDRQRSKYLDDDYMKNVISWPPKMIESLKQLTRAVGDAGDVDKGVE